MRRFFLSFVFCFLSVYSYAQSYMDILKSKTEEKDAKALYDLCCYYANRSSEESDINLAVSYLLKAAEKDYPEALYELGCCYKNGALGLPVWEEKAKEYLFRASELGYEEARGELEELTKDYDRYRTRIRRSVFDQVVSIAPRSHESKYGDKKHFIRQ